MTNAQKNTLFQVAQSNAIPKLVREYFFLQRYGTIVNIDNNSIDGGRRAAHNSTYKKLAVQWLNEALCFVSSSVLADSFRLRNRQLLVAAKR